MSNIRKETGNNVASPWRWILAVACAIVTGSIVGSIIGWIITIIPCFKDGAYLAPERELLVGISSFLGIFLMFIVFLKAFCKTSLRDFLFGAGRKADIKGTAFIGVIFIIGCILSYLVDVNYISFDSPDFGLWIINFFICLALVWIQTTTEEIFFRGVFLRAFHGNDIPSFKKGIWPALLSSVLFMALHLSNPEVSTLSGLDAFLTGATYFIAGMGMYLPNLVIGGMEAGIIIHLINNFLCFTFLRSEITVMPTPTVFVDTASTNLGVRNFVMVVILYLPVIVYSLLTLRKRAKNEAAK